MNINQKTIDDYQSILESHMKNVCFTVDDVKNIPKKYKIDAIVSPANSYGFMTGGIDIPLKEIFPNIDNKLKTIINAEKYAIDTRGEPYLPIGKCITLTTNNADCPYMLSVPTMHMPGSIIKTINVYLAFSAIL